MHNNDDNASDIDQPIPYRLTALALTELGRERPRPCGPTCLGRFGRIPPRGSDFETWRKYFEALAAVHGRAVGIVR